MRARRRLPLGIRSRSGVLHERRGRPQRAVGRQRERGDAAAAVVGHQNVPPRRVHDDVHGPASDRRLLIERREHAGRTIDGERAHRARVLAAEGAHFVGRIQEPLRRVDREIARAWRFGRQLRWTQRAGGHVEARDVNALALLAGVGAEIHEDVGATTASRLLLPRRGRGKGARHDCERAERVRGCRPTLRADGRKLKAESHDGSHHV